MIIGIGGVAVSNSISKSSFNPTKVAGLKLWLDAANPSSLFQTSGGSSATANNDPIGEWKDISGTNNNFTQSVTNARPLLKTNSMNGLPTIKGDGIDDRLRAAGGITSSSDFTVFVVLKMSVAAASQQRPFGNVDGSSGKNGFCYITSSAALGPTLTVACNNAGTQSSISWAQTYVANTGYIHTYEHSSSLFAYVNNTQKGTASALTMDNQQPFALFSDGTPAGGSYASCDIGEVLIYKPALDATNRTKIYNYLKSKWGL